MTPSINQKIGVIPVLSESNHHNQRLLITSKIVSLQNIIKRAIMSAQRYKTADVFGVTELNICVQSLETFFISLQSLQNTDLTDEAIVTKLQEITNELSSNFRTFGCDSIEDLLEVCFGSDYASTHFTTNKIQEQYMVMKEHVHPIGYKIMSWKNNSDKDNVEPIKKNRIVEDFMIVQNTDNLECFDLARTSKSFQTKVYGIKFGIHNPEQRRTILVCGLVDDIMLQCLDYPFIINKLNSLHNFQSPDIEIETFKRFIKCITLKEFLVYNESELHSRFIGYINQVSLVKQKTISQITKEFIASELYGQRTTLIQLLLKETEHEYQYLAYLLYDLLSNDTNGVVDTQEQTLLFDSLPWDVKKYFRNAMKLTIDYTNNLSNFDNTKIPLEQQICLMKADDHVKEKAMQKLKEVKSKSDDSGSKARQYLEGLLRIPFSIYKDEPILRVMSECTQTFDDLVHTLNNTTFPVCSFPNKSSYTSMEMRKYIGILKNEQATIIHNKLVNMIKSGITETKRDLLVANICTANSIIRKHNITYKKLLHSGRKTSFMQNELSLFIDHISSDNNLLLEIGNTCGVYKESQNILSILSGGIAEIEAKSLQIKDYMKNVTDTLNDAVYGHDTAKRQIERIIGQWINGEKTGYCFGFEGPPGVGKTSLAKKGICDCLIDENGISRPFAFIAIGGSSNGSTLDGHNYTYVGSTWGRIAEILMDKKCMNPIIFIDELDKISKTEHGNEIIGILTHLIDSTQNDAFEDKYFTGIDLDLSKALFVFSYNDVDAIDRVLLDRIHRIKFKHLTLNEKLIITKNYLLPELYKKMGLENMIVMSDDVVGFIIEEYTAEPGVRKLKELLFEIIGEINLELLRNSPDYQIPIVITTDDIKYNYLKCRHSIKLQCVPLIPRVGVINGLWANSLGKGGILPIEIHFAPSESFLEMKLTGMQGDVMKESMTVAKTLAWSLVDKNCTKTLETKLKKNKTPGIHIHVPEGGTPKDGPSGGTAITVALYSLLSNRKIYPDIAITGEICLQGNILPIGGLDLKIIGGIRAGVKRFIFPAENNKDFNDFYEKYENSNIINGIEFIQVNTIQDVLDKVFCD